MVRRKLLGAALVCAAAVMMAGAARADERSERAAAELLRKKLEKENPADKALLDAVKGKDVVVVAGSMDHIEQVLAAARIRHTVIQPEQVAEYPLKSSMILMVNCPGHIPDPGVRRIERFVRAGGLLYTTDWSLLNLVQKAFPKTIVHNGKSTGNEVVPVKVSKKDDNLMSQMLLRKSSEPQWWLEGGSYPIQIVDDRRVEVLATSDELGARYGASPVVVRFRWEDGEVIHVVSHFVRQMATSGPAVAAADGKFEGLSDDDLKEFKKSEEAQAKLGDVESSYAFQRMTANIVTGKQKRNVELEKLYNQTVGGTAQIRSAPSASAAPVTEASNGTRMRVIGRKGDQVQVRDEMGNEGWVSQSELVAH
ncbi:MAG: SH3 domain-containing protein [Myxococcales bacterium]|nr:SH3 domain-containing protein [Myxococcales bacterium]